MKNKKGFTLVELIAVIVILALLAAIGIPAYNSIRKSVLEKQYQNLVALIETNATKLASSKDINITNVQELIDEGLLETDDGENIYDPRDKSVMNCFLIEVEYSNDTYTSKLLDIKNCDLSAARIEYSKIKIIAKGDESNTTIDFNETDSKWVKENVTLSVDNSKLTEPVNKYRWVVANGKTGADATMKMSAETILNTNVNVEVTTTGGNKYFAKTPVRIDKEKPLIMDIEVAGGNNWANGKLVNVKASDQKGSGIAGYYIGKSACNSSTSFAKTTATNYETKIAAEEFDANEQDIYICVIDKAGNIQSQKTTFTMTDETPPECVWSREYTTWTKNNRTITLTCEDSESGCAPGYESFSETFDTTTKTAYLSYIIKDRAGNTTTCNKTVNVYVDKDAPFLGVEIYKWATNDEASRPTASTYRNLSSYTPNQNKNSTSAWSDKKLFTIALGQDSESKVLSYTYTTTGQTTNNTNASGYTRNIEAQGTSTIQYKVCDEAGNCTTSDVYTVHIDRAGPTAPTMNFVYEDWTVYPNNTWTKNDVYAGRTSSGDHGPTGSRDYGIGLSHYEISKDGTNWVKFNYDYNSDMYKMSTTGTHTRYFRAVDKLGKASAATTLTAKIDKQAPTVPTVVLKKWANNSTQPTSSNYTTLDNYTSGTETEKKIYTYATSTDSHSGGIEYYYTTTGATTNATDYNARSRNIEAMGTSYIKYKACDAVGNCSNYSQVYTIIRKNSVTISGNISEWVCGKCTNACTLGGDKPYRAQDSNGDVIFAFDGRCGNTIGKVTYTASGNNVTFNWEIRQGKYTYIYSSYWVKFIIKNSSKTLHTVTLKSSSGSNWGGGSVHTGTVKYTFKDKGTYYIYIDGNSSDPGFDMNFGTITVS